MMEFLRANQPVFDFFLLTLGFAYSQQVVLRAGVFSLASAAFSCLGAYGCAYLVVKAGLPVPAGGVQVDLDPAALERNLDLKPAPAPAKRPAKAPAKATAP